VHREAIGREKIVVEKGSAVIWGVYRAPDQPPSPDQPRKSKTITLPSE
jgi:hypothetical protein